MIFFTLYAMAFLGWLAWQTYQDHRANPPASMKEWAMVIGFDFGLLCAILASAYALVR